MSLTRKLGSDALVSWGGAILIQIYQFLVLVGISYTLGVGQYGVYAQVIAVVGIVSIFSGLGLHDSLVRFGQKKTITFPSLFSTLFIATGLINAVLAGAFISSADVISHYALSEQGNALAFRMGGLLIFIRGMGRFAAETYRVRMDVKRYTLLMKLQQLAPLLPLTVAFLLFSPSLVEVFSTIVLAEAFVMVAIIILAIRREGLGSLDLDLLYPSLQFSVPQLASNLSGNILTRADRVLLGVFIGPTAVGIYSVAYGVGNAIWAMTNAISVAFFPEFSRLVEEGRVDEVATHLREGIRYHLAIATPGVAGLAVVSTGVYQLLAGEMSPPSVTVLIPVLAFGMLLWGLDSLYGVILLATERTKTAARIRGGAAILNIVLNIALIPIFGISGAAVATVLSYAASSSTLFYQAKHEVKATFPIKTAITTASIAILMGVTLEFLDLSSLVITVLLGAVIYLSLAALFTDLLTPLFQSIQDAV